MDHHHERNEKGYQEDAGTALFHPSAASTSKVVIVACRKSELAQIQARHVVSQLEKALPHPPRFQVATRSVVGDADKQTPFLQLSKQTGGSDVGKSLWTNGLEEDLLSGKAHILVHSLKDMPTTLPPNCLLGAIPEREEASDAAIMTSDSMYKTIGELPPGSVVGSSSSRRRALIRYNWPHLEVAECRGNVETRLTKLDAPDSEFSCILLATAGLLRLGLGHRITQRLDPKVFPYAVGQGALGIEIKSDCPDTLRLVNAADHKKSRWLAMAERAMLRTLQGGCSSPIGVSSVFETPQAGGDGMGSSDNRGGDRLRLSGTVLDVEGTTAVSAEYSALVDSDEEAEAVGVELAKILSEKGASNLLSEARPS